MLFSVSKIYFEKHSSVFKDMLSLPPGRDDARGASDANPIHLEGISCVDFERLLAEMCPM